MKILGMEKLSLVDYDGYISATLFLGGCNFRCPFCHNGPLVLDASNQPEIPLSEVLSYLEKRKNMLKGVCITGGEPTLYPDLEDLIKQIIVNLKSNFIKLNNHEKKMFLERFVKEIRVKKEGDDVMIESVVF